MDAKNKSKSTCFLCEELIKIKTPDLTRGKIHERVKLFSMQHKIGDFHNEFYIKQIEKLAYHRSYYKILGKHLVAGAYYEEIGRASIDGCVRVWCVL